MKLISTNSSKSSFNGAKCYKYLRIILVLSIFIINETVYSQAPCFKSIDDYSYNIPNLSDYPQCVNTGDINSDGYMDIVYISGLSKIVTLINSGNGTYIAGNTYTVGQYPRLCLLKDLTGDNHPDIVVFNDGSNSLSILLGNGSGGFASHTTINNILISPEQLRSMMITDMNNDLKNDIILGIGNSLTEHIDVMLGAGNGFFAAPLTYISNFNWLDEMNIGDFNNDGKKDVITMGNSTIIHFGNGLGSFNNSTLITNTLTTPNWVRKSAVGDLNNDGKLDFVTTSSEKLTIYIGNGTGSFTTSSITVATGNMMTSGTADICPVQLSDIDADNKLDIILLGNNNSLTFIKGNGNGTFTFLDKKVLVSHEAAIPTYISVSDMNNDGKKDVVTSAGGRIFTLLNQGNFNFNGINKYDYGLIDFQVPQDCKLADVNMDGLPDMIFIGYSYANSNNFVSVRLNTGNGTFSAPTLFTTPTFISNSLNQLIVEDIDGDLKKDLVIISQMPPAPKTIVFKGDNMGNFTYTSSLTTNFNYTAADFYITKIYDFNNDGNKDIFLYGSSFSGTKILEIYSGNGSGAFTFLTSYTFAIRASDYCLGDFNKDGKVDLAYVCENTAKVFILNGNGIDSLTAGGNYSISKSAPSTIKCKDLNSDGNLDLIVGVYDKGNNIAILEGTANGIFLAASHYTNTSLTDSSNITSIDVEDIDSDGILDLITSNQLGSFSILNGMGNGNYDTAVYYHLDRGFPKYGLSIVDVNNDGKKDITLFSSDFTILYNSCGLSTDINSNELNLNNNTLLYPNPANDNFNILALSKIFKIDVLNNLGQLVLSKENMNTLNYNVDISGLVSGIYFVRIQTLNGLSVQKIIKE